MLPMVSGLLRSVGWRGRCCQSFHSFRDLQCRRGGSAKDSMAAGVSKVEGELLAKDPMAAGSLEWGRYNFNMVLSLPSCVYLQVIQNLPISPTSDYRNIVCDSISTSMDWPNHVF